MSGGYDRPWASAPDSPLPLRPQQLTEMQIVVKRFEVGLAVQRTHHFRAVPHPARDRGGARTVRLTLRPGRNAPSGPLPMRSCRPPSVNHPLLLTGLAVRDTVRTMTMRQSYYASTYRYATRDTGRGWRRMRG